MTETGLSPGAKPTTVSANVPSTMMSVGCEVGGPLVVESTTVTYKPNFPASLHGANGPTHPAHRATIAKRVRRASCAVCEANSERRRALMDGFPDGGKTRMWRPVREDPSVLVDVTGMTGSARVGTLDTLVHPDTSGASLTTRFTYDNQLRLLNSVHPGAVTIARTYPLGLDREV